MGRSTEKLVCRPRQPLGKATPPQPGGRKCTSRDVAPANQRCSAGTHWDQPRRGRKPAQLTAEER
ncbi:Hypothetical predicted protein, partial [Marmota monax]